MLPLGKHNDKVVILPNNSLRSPFDLSRGQRKTGNEPEVVRDLLRVSDLLRLCHKRGLSRAQPMRPP